MGIGNKLVFDVNGNVEDFIFVLSTKDFRHLGAIQNVIPESVHHSGSLVNGNEISFEVYKVVEKEIDDEVKDVEEPLWDDITNLKLVYVRELDEYFEMSVQIDDTTEVIKKTVTCTSLCKAELSQWYIRGLEVNTEADIARDDYEPTIFCNDENPNASLLHRVFSFAPHYTIKHVDESLKKLQRTFSVDESTIYDWLTGDCAKEFNCLFQFDTTSRGVYVYDLYTVCKDCGHRGDYIDKCPECGSTNLDYFGEDTTIYIDKENLTDAIQLTTDVGAIKNCFYLEAGDDVITATARILNMNGTGYLFLPTDEQLAEMPEELRNKIVSYNEKYLAKKDEYEGIIANLFETKAEIDRLTHIMMPTIEHAEITAQTEADKLTAMNLSPLGLDSVTTSTTKATVESALKNYAKAYVKTGYVKLDINQSEYTYVGAEADGWNHGTWTGNFKVTNYSDEEDVVYSEVITVDVYDNYQEFIEQKIMKNVANNSDEESSVFDVFSISELDDFKEALKLYCLKRLESFYDAFQSALDVLLEEDQANDSADLYEPLYLQYYEKLQACQAELDARQITIDEWIHKKDNYVLQQQEIQADLNFQDYLGEDLYKIFCMYRREDTYRNENYISDGLTDSEQIQKAKDFLDVAQKELEKARTPKHSISATLYNLLLIPEFKPIIDHFKLGNWLRICVDGIVYRLRLIGYDLSFSSTQTLSVEFSNVTKLNTIANETKEILDDAKSMASNFDYFVSQAKRGNEANVEINRWLEKGLESGLVNIKNNNNEEVTFDKHGLLIRSYDDITGNYLPEQARFTHNILCLTENNWASSSLAIGKHNYTYFDGTKFVTDVGFGMSAKFLNSAYFHSGQIIGADIYSENYKVDVNGNVIAGSHLALKTGGFSLASGKLTYDPVTDKVTLKGITIQWDTTTTPEISDIDGLEDSLVAALEKAEEGIQKGLEGINLANNAQQYAEGVNANLSAEITNRINADNELITDLTNAYQTYTDSSVSNLDKSVANYLGVGGGTLITEKGVISPYIAGGYLNITNASNNSKVIIDPNNLTGNGYIFQVHNGSEVSVGIKSDGSASFNGHVTATSLTLGTGVSISSDNITGLSSVATSGKYSDLDGTPTIPTSVADLGLDTTTILYKGDITQTTKTDSNGITYLETSVPSSSGTVTYSTYDADDYIVFGRSKGSDSEGNNYICVSKDGLLTARNALIYGTVYATDGEFTGKIFAEKGGTIAGFNIGDTAIYNGTDSLTSTNSGVYIGTDGIRQYNSDTANVTISNGVLTANGANISGILTAGSGSKIGGWTITDGKIYAGDGTTVKTAVMQAPSENIEWVFAAGGSTHTSYYDAPFRVNKSGDVYCERLYANTSGEIAGWQITSSRLKKVDENSGLYVALCSPTQLGHSGDGVIDAGTGDVLVVRTGKTESEWEYPFCISSDGYLYATNVNIKGTINATSGSFSGTIKAGAGSTIGGWTLADGKIYGGTSSAGVAVMQAPSSNIDWVFAAGGTSHSAYADCPFRVHKTGALYATSGKIGDWNFGLKTVEQGTVKYSGYALYAETDSQYVYLFNTGVCIVNRADNTIDYASWTKIIAKANS